MYQLVYTLINKLSKWHKCSLLTVENSNFTWDSTSFVKFTHIRSPVL